MNTSNNLKATITNLTVNAGNVKRAGLLLTASIILVHTAHSKEEQDKAQAAIRKAFIDAGYVKMDKGTKQPNSKARRFMKAAESAYDNYLSGVTKAIKGAANIEAQTIALADYCESFALSGNHYEGDVYLMPLTLAISKAEARKRNAAKTVERQEVADSDVTVIPAKGDAAERHPNAKKVVSRAMQVTALLPSLLTMLNVPEKEKPSLQDASAVINAFSEIDAALRLIRNETVPSASKEARKLAVAIGKFYAVQKAAHEVVKAKAAKKAVKKAA